MERFRKRRFFPFDVIPLCNLTDFKIILTIMKESIKIIREINKRKNEIQIKVFY